jgi:hypothetical protein
VSLIAGWLIGLITPRLVQFIPSSYLKVLIRSILPFNNRRSSDIVERYLPIKFMDNNMSFEYYVPLKRGPIRSVIITGAKSGRTYPFHPRLIPPISATLLGEISWKVQVEDEEEKILSTLENFSL